MIDSHTHLDFCEPPNTDLVAAAEEAGVTRMLTVGTDGASCRAALQAAEDFPQVYAAIGRHPNSAAGFDDADFAELEALAAHSKCVAIGETGLDYYRDYAPASDQRRAFEAQIELARATGKPLVIHTRAAAEDTLRIMREEDAGAAGGVMHCFTESWETASACLDLGFHISFSGIVTFRNAKDLHEVARRVPLERMLIETDSPYLAPVPYRGKTNEPAYVKHVAEGIAALRGIPVEEVAARTSANFFRLFAIEENTKA